MPVPANRVPVRVARGTYANLSANLASLEEGEVVYANDEDRLYIVEGGVLVATTSSATGGASSLDGLSDASGYQTVGAMAERPTFDAAWPGTYPNLASDSWAFGTNGNISAANLFVDNTPAGFDPSPNQYTKWRMTFDGSHTYVLNCADVVAQDGGARYVWTFSQSAGSGIDGVASEEDDFFAMRDEVLANGWNTGLRIEAIDAPSAGQALVWNGDRSQFEPETLASDVTSVNGQTGAVSLKVANLADAFDYTVGIAPQWDVRNTVYINGPGDYNEWYQQDNDQFQISIQDNTATDLTSWFQSWQVGDELAFYDASNNLLATTNVLSFDDPNRLTNPTYYSHVFTVSPVVTFPLVTSGALQIQNNTRPYGVVPPVDGEALIWVDANSRWEPAGLTVSGLSDVNTVTSTVYEFNSEQTAAVDLTSDGRWQYSFGEIMFYQNDANGQDFLTPATAMPSTGTIYISTDGVNYTAEAYTYTNQISSRPTFGVATSYDGAGTVYVSLVAPGIPDGQVLTWVDANGQWEPASTGIQTASDFELNAAAGTGPVTRTLQPSNSNTVTSGGVGASIISAGYTYWAYGPDGSAAGTNFLTYLRDSASFPINVDINGTIVEVQAVANQADSGGNGGSLRLDHTGLTSTSQISGTSWTLAPETATTQPLADGDILQWSAADSKFKPTPLGIDTLADVDTSTVAPTDGQVLTYVAANSQWEPATAGIQTASDFELNPGTFPYWATKTGATTPSAGEWFANGTNVMRANPVDSNGTDWTAEMTALGTTGTFWHSTDATNWTQTTNAGGFDNLPTWFQFNLSPFNANSHTGGLYISFTDPASAPGAPLADGDILQWSAADSAFKPLALQGTAVRTILGIGEYVDDAAAGTGGVASGAMYYNTTSSDYRLKT